MDYYELMEAAAELGTKLAESGAETYRIEESINRMVGAYQVRSRVYSVPNSLIITILPPEGPPITQLCRIDKTLTDMEGIERYSNLGRRICSEKPSPSEAMQWLQETDKQRKQYPFPLILLGNVMTAIGFCVFFGGTLADSLCAGVCGLMLGFVTHWLDRLNTNVFFQKITAAFLLAFCAYWLNSLGLSQNADMVVIGPMMLLVPGLLFTNALRDIIFGDTNSGINRIVQVLLVAVAIALGVAAAWNVAEALWGVPVVNDPAPHSPLLTVPISLLACSGFVIIFNVHGRGKILCALGGAVTWAAYCICLHFGAGELLCCFLATVTATVFSEVMARVRKYPATSYLVISLLPLIPGAGIYYTAQQAVQGNLSQFISQGTETLSTAGVMAVGIIVVTTLIRLWHNRHSVPKQSMKIS